MTTLASGRSKRPPWSFAETSEGILLIASGLDAVQRWDGLRATSEDAGLEAPSTNISLAGSGSGDIVGTYTAYQRFRDRDGNYSNLSPVSAELTATQASGTVTAASNAAPIVITTSAAHGLSTGRLVKIEGVGGNDAANETWTITVLTTTTFSLDGSVGNGTYKGSGTWKAGYSQIDYSSVDIPTDSTVTTRQILRNTDGQTDVYYVDVETTDLSSTTFNSTKDDETLSTGTAVTLLDSDDRPLGNQYTPPPDTKRFIAAHLGRMFMAGEVVMREGAVSVTNNSATVTGIGTDWTSALEDRYLFVAGATASYLIDSVDVTNQTLTLSEVYAGSTDAYASYAIRPAEDERKNIVYSQANLPEAWPGVNGFLLQEDSDEITALMTKGSFLYIIERQHVFRFSFKNAPATDGFVFLAANRGCINNRCWVNVQEVSYMLDEQGVHVFAGTANTLNVSAPINDLFENDPRSRWRINWAAREYFHAVHHPAASTIRWYVALASARRPRHALVFNYEERRWWIEEYAVPITASVLGLMDQRAQVYLGSQSNRKLALGAGVGDGPAPAAGTVRGTVTSAGPSHFADSSASFASSGLVGAPVCIVAGRGKNQVRVVSAVSGATVRTTQPWSVQPDDTSVYQLGGIPWQYRTGRLRWGRDAEMKQKRRVAVEFEPVTEDATFDIRVFRDWSDEPFDWGSTRTSEEGGGVATTADDPDAVCDLTKTQGYVQVRLDAHREMDTDGPRRLAVELRGMGGAQAQRYYSVTIDGAEG